MEDGDDLFESTDFKVFQLKDSTKNSRKETDKTYTNNFKWKKYLIIGGIIIIVRILMKIIFK